MLIISLILKTSAKLVFINDVCKFTSVEVAACKPSLPLHQVVDICVAIGSNGAYDEVFDKQRTSLNFECQEQYTRGCLDSSMMLPTGGNQPHNNLPPYRVVNMWQRVA